MNEYFDGSRNPIAFVYQGRKSESESHDHRCDDHFGISIIFQSIYSASHNIKYNTYETEDGKCHSDTYYNALKQIFHIHSSYNPRYFLNSRKYVLET